MAHYSMENKVASLLWSGLLNTGNSVARKRFSKIDKKIAVLDKTIWSSPLKGDHGRYDQLQKDRKKLAYEMPPVELVKVAPIACLFAGGYQCLGGEGYKFLAKFIRDVEV